MPSRSVAELARFINVPSNNFAAEMLFRELGARYRDRGTLANGAAVVRRRSARSGCTRISSTARACRATIARRRARSCACSSSSTTATIGTAFRASLAVAGRTGTVKARMRGTPADGRCQVKTGTLRLVSGLSGYCHTAGGRDIAFSFMSNRANTPAAKAREDRMTVAIARLSGTAVATPPATSPPVTMTGPEPATPAATVTTSAPAPSPPSGGAAPQP